MKRHHIALSCVLSALAFSSSGPLLAQSTGEDIVGPWTLVKATGLMDDKDISGMFTEASQSEGDFAAEPMLMVRCYPKHTVEVVMYLHGERLRRNGRRTNIRLRHDKGKAYWAMGSLVAGTVQLDVNPKWFEHVYNSSTLSIEVTFTSGTTGVAVFPVAQLRPAIKTLLGDCQ